MINQLSYLLSTCPGNNLGLINFLKAFMCSGSSKRGASMRATQQGSWFFMSAARVKIWGMKDKRFSCIAGNFAINTHTQSWGFVFCALSKKIIPNVVGTSLVLLFPSSCSPQFCSGFCFSPVLSRPRGSSRFWWKLHFVCRIWIPTTSKRIHFINVSCSTLQHFILIPLPSLHG